MNHLILGDPCAPFVGRTQGIRGVVSVDTHADRQETSPATMAEVPHCSWKDPQRKKGTLRGSGCPKVVGLSKEVGKQSSELRRTFIWVTLHHKAIHHTTIHLTKGCEVVTIHHTTIHHTTIHLTKGGEVVAIHHVTILHRTIHHTTIHLPKGGEVVAIHHVTILHRTIHHTTIHHIAIITIHHTTLRSSDEGWWWTEVMGDGEGWWRREVVT